jgi:hypothetical protein
MNLIAQAFPTQIDVKRRPLGGLGFCGLLYKVDLRLGAQSRLAERS